MNSMRRILVAVALLALAPIAAQALIQSQRDQIGIGIIINVTPNPLGYAPNRSSGATDMIIAKASLHGAPASVERMFEAQQLHFTSGGIQVAQTAQKGVKVDAHISPNPLATLLYSDQNSVTLNVEAGIVTAFPCVYHVTVSTAQTSWTLKHGLSADFTSGSSTFVGGSVANNTHIGPTPLPTSTPFVVYSTDGGVWSNLPAGSGSATYCVDLTLSVPIATPQGTYSSNAIYTLYY